jgi:hypothetical protein
MREHIIQHMDGHAAEVLRLLEDVRSAEEAQDAAPPAARSNATGDLIHRISLG